MLTPLEAEQHAAMRAVAALMENEELRLRRAVMQLIRGPMAKAALVANARDLVASHAR